jgi:ATP-dependent Clp protease ATP-binding subunit ClpA
MVSLFKAGTFSPDLLNEPRAAALLRAAADRTRSKMRPSDLLAAAVSLKDAKVQALLVQSMQPGSSTGEISEVIEVYNPACTNFSDFDGRRERFTENALDALDAFCSEYQQDTEGAADTALELLLACILDHLEAEDRDYITFLDAPRAAALLRERVKASAVPLAPLFDAASGRLRSEEFSEAAWNILEHAAARAGELGYDRLLPPHCFLALLGETEGITEQVVRLQARPEIGPGKVAECVADSFRLAASRVLQVELTRDGLGDPCVDLLRRAQKTARVWGSEYVDNAHLLLSMLEACPPRLEYVLSHNPLNLDLGKMGEHTQQFLREMRTQGKREVAFRLPPGMFPCEDLTFRARTEGLTPGLHLDAYFDPLTRALYRQGKNHVLITGLRGVGKTTLVYELARRAAAGQINFLKRRRFLWVDCQDATPEGSRDKLNAILGHISGRTDLILCLDGLGPLLRAENGANNKLLLRAALKERRVHLIGILSNSDYDDLFTSDHELLEYFTRVEVKEADIRSAVDMVEQACIPLQHDFKVKVDRQVIERSVILSANYILNERLPVKAIKILRRVCEDLNYDRTQRDLERDTVAVEDIIKTISEISGVPPETLKGVTTNVNYEKDLGANVIGQPDAVGAVAEELSLIKAGLSNPGKPASVMMFAGLTGVGKSELAKTLARFYSSSKRLQVYTMGNFLESHSVSGIIGVPPGYVGHEQGGRLINDLNSDPYCVFLLDEAEKAHPDIWKPFLNLFDEGWVTDQRAVKAFADRAIFILTSNAGADIIAKMTAEGKDMEKEIIPAVKDALSQVRHQSTNQIVFSPEFLARIKRIIIFKPLDEAAMLGICRKLVSMMCATWKEKREKTIVVPEALVQFIARRSHEENYKSGGKEGGRIVSKLISKYIEASIQREASARESEYRTSQVVELIFVPPGPVLPAQPPPEAKVLVNFRTETSPTPPECFQQALQELQQALKLGQEGRQARQKSAQETLAHLRSGLERWKASDPAGLSPAHAALLEQFAAACRAEQANPQERSTLEDLLAPLQAAGR